MESLWIPSKDCIDELLLLFNESLSNKNEKHREIFEKINNYSKTKYFINYLLYILNCRDFNSDIRRISGLTLKGVLERSFNDLDEEEIEYFKQNVLNCYSDPNQQIRKTISNLVNNFLKLGGIEIWPQILELLYVNLDSEVASEMSLEIIVILIEDSGSFIQERCSEVKNKL